MDILRRLVSSYAKPAKTRRRRPHLRLPRGLELLEERLPMAAYVVNSLGDGAPAADGQLTLREAITAANTNAPSGDAPAGDTTPDTIRFDFSIHYRTIILSAAQGNLEITGGGDLNIIGPDATRPAGIVLSGNNAIRVFNIASTANQVTISDLTVTQGNAGSGLGGGILNTGPHTTLNNVAVTNNFAMRGGGISNSSGLLTIRDSLISGNATNPVDRDGDGGGIGGGVYSFDGDVTVIRCEISGNVSPGGGGALYGGNSILHTGVIITILDSLISGNKSGESAWGGGIISASENENQTLHVQGCTISGNWAGVNGGGIVANGTATIINSTIAFNIARVWGGGIYFGLQGARVTTLTIVNATIVGNTTLSAFTAPNAGGIVAFDPDMIHMSNSIVSLNAAPIGPGGEENVELADLDTNLANFIGGDPRLGPLQDNGGPTPTMLPLPGSPVIDSGSDTFLRFRGVTTDQRGYERFVDGIPPANKLTPPDRAVDIGAVEFTPLPAPLVVGADAGGGPHVKVYLPDGSLRFSFFAYDAGFTGGVRVATGDVSGDGVADIITVPGSGGGPHVKVFNGVNGALIRSFFAYDAGFTGGLYVAAGDVNGDGWADIITGAGAGGGPHVRVFSGNGGAELASFFAYDPGFGGGVRVAAGDLDADGRADIITAAGPTGAPHVKAFSGANMGMVLRSFFSFDVAFTGGVYIAAGDTNGDGQIDIIAGAGEGARPTVRVFNGANPSLVLLDFLAYAQNFTGGVRVGAVDRNGDGRADILTAAGPTGGPHVRTFDGLTAAQLDSFFAFEASFLGGTFIS